MLELNKKHRFINISSSKEIQYRRKVDMHELKLYPYFMFIIYKVNNEDIYEKGL